MGFVPSGGLLIRNGLRSIGCALAFAAVVSVSCGWAQIASSSSLLTTDGSASDSNISPSPNPVSPNNVALNNQSAHAVPDLPSQPKGKTTLMGGKIRSVDHVRDRIVLDIFGGGHMTVLFDERTHVFSADQPASL